MAESLGPKPSKKKFYFLLVVALLLFLGGALTYLLFADDPGDAASPPKADHRSGTGAMMALEPFLVNLADADSRRYLKIKLDLEVDQEKTLKELEKAMPRLRDAVILLLSSKTYGDLNSAEGKRRLKEEILKQLASISGEKKIRNVFFTEFVAQ